MSIINDALQKTQKQLNQEKVDAEALVAKVQQRKTAKEKPTVTLRPDVTTAAENHSNKLGWFGMLSVTFIAIVLAGGALFGVEKFMHADFKLLDFASKPAKSVALDPVANLHLSGTMAMGSEWIAVINKHVYHVGDVINGLKIEAISINQVKLGAQNKDYYLSNNNTL